MLQNHLIVIGGTAAGLSAASAARRADPSLPITVFEKTGYISYGSCGLPYYIGGVVENASDLVTFTPDQLRHSRNIAVHTHHEVKTIDREQKQVHVANLQSGETEIISYSRLVIATGASPIRLPIPGASLDGVFTLRFMEDGIAIKSRLSAGRKRIVLIGGGFIGLELAAELTEAGHGVTVLEERPRLLPMLPEAYSAMVLQTLKQSGVTVLLNTRAKEIQGTPQVEAVLANEERVPADLVIMATGVRPNTALAVQADLQTGLYGTIAVDERQQTSDPAIWACGDCVQMYHSIDHSPVYIPLGTTANKQGKVAGLNAAGGNAKFAGVLGSQITKIFGLYVGSTGMTPEQAASNGFLTERCSITKADKASYYPGAEDNHLTLIFEKVTGRLLGAQAAGGASISGRLNTLATAIYAGLTVDELNNVDYVYAPPVAPVYDPLLIAASQSMKLVNGR